MSDNRIVQILENNLDNRNVKLNEIWFILQNRQLNLKDGGIWNIILVIHEELQAVRLALLVLFLLLQL